MRISGSERRLCRWASAGNGVFAGEGGVVKFKSDRKVYVYLPQIKGGKSRVRLNGSEDAVLEEGDGAFVSGVNAGDGLVFESIGQEEAEVVVLDANPN
jgi:hypothetical protein